MSKVNWVHRKNSTESPHTAFNNLIKYVADHHLHGSNMVHSDMLRLNRSIGVDRPSWTVVYWQQSSFSNLLITIHDIHSFLKPFMLMSWQGRQVNTLPSDLHTAPNAHDHFKCGSALEQFSSPITLACTQAAVARSTFAQFAVSHTHTFLHFPVCQINI